jgi:hypothetical protein
MTNHRTRLPKPISTGFARTGSRIRPLRMAAFSSMITPTATAAPQFAARDRSHPYPAGSVIVKDGFIVTKEGNILTAPMNIIEKVPASAVSTDDWRFIQIRPNGTIIGAAAGDERTRFCAECHIQRNGALAPFFFVPSGNDGKPLARLRESDGLGVRAPGG